MYNLKEFKEVFDPVLQEYLETRLKNFTDLTSDNFVKEFVLYSEKITLSSGKRVRPYLAFLMYMATGGTNIKAFLKLIVSIEIFHMSTLIHDDIMDKATTRHSITTMHKYIADRLNEEKRLGDFTHVGNSQAILVGDLLFSFVTEILTLNNDFEEKNLIKARTYFYKMAEEVFLGQMLDVDLATKENADIDLINEKTRLKTTRHSCVGPMKIGMALADSNSNLDDFCELVGTKAGIALQLQDDLLDIMGDTKTLTKSTLTDLAEHQQTFFTHYVLQYGSEQQKAYLNKIFGTKIEENEKENVRKLFVESGAIDAGKKLIVENLNEARYAISRSSLQEEYKNHLNELLDLLANREN